MGDLEFLLEVLGQALDRGGFPITPKVSRVTRIPSNTAPMAFFT